MQPMVTDKTRRRLLLGALRSVALRPLSAIVMVSPLLGSCTSAVNSANAGQAAIIGCSRQTNSSGGRVDFRL